MEVVTDHTGLEVVFHFLTELLVLSLDQTAYLSGECALKLIVQVHLHLFSDFLIHFFGVLDSDGVVVVSCFPIYLSTLISKIRNDGFGSCAFECSNVFLDLLECFFLDVVAPELRYDDLFSRQVEVFLILYPGPNLLDEVSQTVDWHILAISSWEQ